MSYIVVHQNPSDSVISTVVSAKARKRVADACEDLVGHARCTDPRGALVVRSDTGEEMCAVEPVNGAWCVVRLSTDLSKAAIKHLAVIGFPEPGMGTLESETTS